MSDGRKTEVILLDDRRLEIVTQVPNPLIFMFFLYSCILCLLHSKFFAGELLDLVASHFNLREKEFFGLAFKDET